MIIEGTAAAPTNRERLRGYKRALAENPGIEVLASGIGNYQQADAKRVMAKFLTEHSQIDAVLSANDSMALGALEALKAANRTAIVIGINGILPAVKQIEAGNMLASVDFNMFKIGCTATRAAVRHSIASRCRKDDAAGRSDRQDQLQGLAGAGRAAHLPGMGRAGEVKLIPSPRLRGEAKSLTARPCLRPSSPRDQAASS